MKKLVAVLAFILVAVVAPAQYAFKGHTVSLNQIGDNSYIHLSYLQTNDFGNVGCNGMVVIKGKKAYIFDTPATEDATEELLRYLMDEKGLKIAAVIPTHFHADCLAGLALCHAREIESIAHELTKELAEEKQLELPKNTFNRDLAKLKLKGLSLFYPGEGHTTDNIVAYYEPDMVLFGGCLIKSNGAGKGNLEDANTSTWSSSVRKVKKHYPKIQKVIPGHGDAAGPELLDYTIRLFAEY
ncbi:subclass B1 metallo-beta-lactamase [Jiulongibacter sediminis]|uniref:subclass B1 metallo-beta-lactamase n=1 Tax=Jiulongibacter sediminis TaxID=1605367 RepID=UPI0026E94CA0|nr:subclass B1 metallo-beta-lactamase [Jiulongibacter sediminis]